MPFGLLLHIPNANSLIHSEYECDIIFNGPGNTVVIEKHVKFVWSADFFEIE